MTIGIYLLCFEGTDQVYIGQSVNIENRYKGHRHDLKTGTGSNTKMHSAYKLYGMPSCNILKTCTIEELDELEMDLINEFDSVTNGLNKIYYPNSGYGGVRSSGSIYSEELIIKSFKLICDKAITIREAASITGIGQSALADISSGIAHKWLSIQFPQEYAIMLKNGEYRRHNCRTAKTLGKLNLSIIHNSGIIIHNIENIRKTAREIGVDPSSLNRVLNNKANQVKGWSKYNGS